MAKRTTFAAMLSLALCVLLEPKDAPPPRPCGDRAQLVCSLCQRFGDSVFGEDAPKLSALNDEHHAE